MSGEQRRQKENTLCFVCLIGLEIGDVAASDRRLPLILRIASGGGKK